MQRDFKKVLLDGDIIAYRAAFSTRDSPDIKSALDKTDELVSNILTQCLGGFYAPNEYQIYLTGEGNFREDIAKTLVYKGNRKGVDKPPHLQEIKEYLQSEYKAIVSGGEEADDLIAIEATKLGYKACIASVDKDFLQVPCWHYNISKQEFSKVSELEGLRFFYSQILTGDRADNIQGVVGIGPKKAEKFLLDCQNEHEMFKVVLDKHGGNVDRVLEDGRLLWLRRKVGEIWDLPKVD